MASVPPDKADGAALQSPADQHIDMARLLIKGALRQAQHVFIESVRQFHLHERARAQRRFHCRDLKRGEEINAAGLGRDSGAASGDRGVKEEGFGADSPSDSRDLSFEALAAGQQFAKLLLREIEADFQRMGVHQRGDRIVGGDETSCAGFDVSQESVKGGGQEDILQIALALREGGVKALHDGALLLYFGGLDLDFALGLGGGLRLLAEGELAVVQRLFGDVAVFGESLGSADVAAADFQLLFGARQHNFVLLFARLHLFEARARFGERGARFGERQLIGEGVYAQKRLALPHDAALAESCPCFHDFSLHEGAERDLPSRHDLSENAEAGTDIGEDGSLRLDEPAALSDLLRTDGSSRQEEKKGYRHSARQNGERQASPRPKIFRAHLLGDFETLRFFQKPRGFLEKRRRGRVLTRRRRVLTRGRLVLTRRVLTPGRVVLSAHRFGSWRGFCDRSLIHSWQSVKPANRIMIRKPAHARALIFALLSFSLLSCETAPRQIFSADGDAPLLRAALLLPLSAPERGWRDAARAMRDAAQLAVFDSSGARLELLVQDTRGTPEGALKAAKAAQAQKAEIVLGPVLAPSVRALKEAGLSVPVLAFSSDTRAAARDVYLLGFSPEQEVARVMDFAAQNGLRRLAAFLPRTAYGFEVRRAFAEAAAKNNLEISRIETYEPNLKKAMRPARRLANYAARARRLEARRAFLRQRVGALDRRQRPLYERHSPGRRVMRARVFDETLPPPEASKKSWRGKAPARRPPPVRVSWAKKPDGEPSLLIGPLLPGDMAHLIWRDHFAPLWDEESEEAEKEEAESNPFLFPQAPFQEDLWEERALFEAEIERLEPFETYGPPPYDAVLFAEGGVRLKAIIQLLPHFDVARRGVRFLGTGLWDDPTLSEAPPLIGGWFAAADERQRRAFASRFQSAYGRAPHRLASIAYDAVSIAALAAGKSSEEAKRLFRAPEGFLGVDGLLRLHEGGLAERGLAILEIGRGGLEMRDPAPRSF